MENRGVRVFEAPASEAPTQPELSVVIPMYNEEEGIQGTVQEMSAALSAAGLDYEILLVNDGSTDGTESVCRDLIAPRPRVRLLSYSPNVGRGRALRTGLRHARGEILASTEADLSYRPEVILRMVQRLRENLGADMVVASPYCPGGRLEKVPLLRGLVSRIGNRVLGLALPGNLTTTTGMTRAYRRHVIDALELESDGKEIHIEILSKVLSLGYCVAEVPAVLSWRRTGKSKFKFRTTAISHLVFALFERPMILFGLIGFALIVAGLLLGLYITMLRFEHLLTPSRPLITLTALVLLAGIQILCFGFIGAQLVSLRRELFKIQRQNRKLQAALGFHADEEREASDSQGEHFAEGSPSET